MHDRIVKSLENMRHVLAVWKILILLSKLHSRGCHFTGEGGGIIVIKDALVLMKGDRANNLYKLIGSTVIGNMVTSAMIRKQLLIKGVTLGEGTGATMSDDEDDEPIQLDYSLEQSVGADFNDMMGFGPLLPTESERSLMERVRHELKLELKQGFKSRIEDVREEILRKRRAGKLPGDTTSVLKTWWQQHSNWPYPTEDDKTKLVEETGLQLKQINNWFINQRKRNWHSNSQSSKTKSKRKR
ncbi:Homeobox protein HD1-like protein [Drosera capensis]